MMEAFVRQNYETLRRFAAVVAPWDVEPDDVLHAVLLRVLRRGNLSSLDDPVAYVRRAIVNHVRSEFRRNGTRRRTMSRLRSERAEVHAPSYPSDLDDLLSLRPVERAVLYLHDVEGYTFEEVAEVVGVKPGNARVMASRARGQLRQELEERT